LRIEAGAYDRFVAENGSFAEAAYAWLEENE
jgi:hypothetical protein